MNFVLLVQFSFEMQADVSVTWLGGRLPYSCPWTDSESDLQDAVGDALTTPSHPHRRAARSAASTGRCHRQDVYLWRGKERPPPSPPRRRPIAVKEPSHPNTSIVAHAAICWQSNNHLAEKIGQSIQQGWWQSGQVATFVCPEQTLRWSRTRHRDRTRRGSHRPNPVQSGPTIPILTPCTYYSTSHHLTHQRCVALASFQSWDLEEGHASRTLPG